MRLFKRAVKLTIATRPTGFVGAHPEYFKTLGNAIEITAMRIQFEVTKNLGKEPNKAVIKVSNLSEHTRSQLEQRPVAITLQAGYDGVTRLLFTGDLVRAISKREGPDIVTTLQVADGMRAFAHARVNRSYKPPIEVKRVLADAAASMGLDLPPEIEQSPMLRQALASGISTRGPTRDVLTRLLAPYGYHWSVQNGKLQVLRDEETRAGTAYLINDEAGVIDSPQRVTSDKPGKPTEIRFDTLLYPELVPGAQAKLESELVNATVKITDVKHEGDTRATGPFRTSVTGRPL